MLAEAFRVRRPFCETNPFRGWTGHAPPLHFQTDAEFYRTNPGTQAWPVLRNELAVYRMDGACPAPTFPSRCRVLPNETGNPKPAVSAKRTRLRNGWGMPRPYIPRVLLPNEPRNPKPGRFAKRTRLRNGRGMPRPYIHRVLLPDDPETRSRPFCETNWASARSSLPNNQIPVRPGF